MNVKNVLYRAGVAGALVSAFLAGGVLLSPIVAQPAPIRSPAPSLQDSYLSSSGQDLVPVRANPVAEPLGSRERGEHGGQAESDDGPGDD